MKEIVKKSFLDINEEEKWLNEQGEKGLMLIHYTMGEYIFDKSENEKYLYQIEILDNEKAKNKKDYFDFLKDMKIETVAEFAGRVYLRKNVSDGEFILYSDMEDNNKQIAKKNMAFFTIAFSQIAIATVFLINGIGSFGAGGVKFWIPIVSSVVFYISGALFLIAGIQSRRKYLQKK